ncbi:hypothetical protein HDU78_005248 [Chytriomyces hyalinus]|nr:hypothetical protein HDU78_005248 [Chytriomyces hyalinus]
MVSLVDMMPEVLAEIIKYDVRILQALLRCSKTMRDRCSNHHIIKTTARHNVIMSKKPVPNAATMNKFLDLVASMGLTEVGKIVQQLTGITIKSRHVVLAIRSSRLGFAEFAHQQQNPNDESISNARVYMNEFLWQCRWLSYNPEWAAHDRRNAMQAHDPLELLYSFNLYPTCFDLLARTGRNKLFLPLRDYVLSEYNRCFQDKEDVMFEEEGFNWTMGLACYLGHMNLIRQITTTLPESERNHVGYLDLALVGNQKRVSQHLMESGIACDGIHVAVPCLNKYAQNVPLLRLLIRHGETHGFSRGDHDDAFVIVESMIVRNRLGYFRDFFEELVRDFGMDALQFLFNYLIELSIESGACDVLKYLVCTVNIRLTDTPRTQSFFILNLVPIHIRYVLKAGARIRSVHEIFRRGVVDVHIFIGLLESRYCEEFSKWLLLYHPGRFSQLIQTSLA